MHTGDLAREDEDGYWYIVDRTKDMIVTGGFNVFPREVEDVVAEHPAVAQVCVVGTPDEKWGEAVTAVVVLRPDAATDDAAVAKMTAEIQAAVKDRKGSVQSPKQVIVVDAVPVTALGKPDKKAVRAQFWEGAAARSADFRASVRRMSPLRGVSCADTRRSAPARSRCTVTPRHNRHVSSTAIRQTVDAVWRMEAAKIVATLTRVSAMSGSPRIWRRKRSWTRWPNGRTPACRATPARG